MLSSFAGLIQLQADGQVADHLDGVVLKAGALVGSIVVGVGDEALGVALMNSSIRYGPLYHMVV